MLLWAESPPDSLVFRLQDWLFADHGQELIAQSGYATYCN